MNNPMFLLMQSLLIAIKLLPYASSVFASETRLYTLQQPRTPAFFNIQGLSIPLISAHQMLLHREYTLSEAIKDYTHICFHTKDRPYVNTFSPPISPIQDGIPTDTMLFQAALADLVMEQPDIQLLHPVRIDNRISITIQKEDASIVLAVWQPEVNADSWQHSHNEVSALDQILRVVYRINSLRSQPAWQKALRQAMGRSVEQLPLGDAAIYTPTQLEALQIYFADPKPAVGQHVVMQIMKEKHHLSSQVLWGHDRQEDQRARFLASHVLMSRTLAWSVRTAGSFLADGRPEEFLDNARILLEAGNLYYNIPSSLRPLTVRLDDNALKASGLLTDGAHANGGATLLVRVSDGSILQILTALGLDAQPPTSILVEISGTLYNSLQMRTWLHPDEYAPRILRPGEHLMIFGDPRPDYFFLDAALVLFGQGLELARRWQLPKITEANLPLIQIGEDDPISKWLAKMGIDFDDHPKLSVQLNNTWIQPTDFHTVQIRSGNILQVHVREGEKLAKSNFQGVPAETFADRRSELEDLGGTLPIHQSAADLSTRYDYHRAPRTARKERFKPNAALKDITLRDILFYLTDQHKGHRISTRALRELFALKPMESHNLVKGLILTELIEADRHGSEQFIRLSSKVLERWHTPGFIEALRDRSDLDRKGLLRTSPAYLSIIEGSNYLWREFAPTTASGELRSAA